ncbi:MAG: transposase [Betaproteobacteria bacterium]|nr:transposase [Betaproteobacteria bacterium]
MARLPRYVLPGQPQHIIQRGNNRQVIFAAEADYQFFRDALVEAAGRCGLAVHAYVWMPNHIHLLATPTYEDSISKTFQSAGRKYAQYFNFTYRRSGTLWAGRYRATVVDTEHYFLRVMGYIEQNPVRAGMVSHPRDYPWSSHRKYAYGEDGANLNWLIEHDEYLKLGRDTAARKVAYRELFRGEIEADVLASIRDCTHKGWALGDTRFREEISGLSDRRAAPAARGRPRVQDTIGRK